MEADRPSTRARRAAAATSETVTSAEIDQLYRPQTKETKQAYEVLLNLLQTETGGTADHELLRSLADETLATLKQEKVTQPAKKKSLEEVYRTGSSLKGYTLKDEVFARLVNITNKISDYKTEIELAVADASDQKDIKMAENEDDLGVSVVFDAADERKDSKDRKMGGGEEDEKGADNLDEVRDAEEADEDEGKEETTDTHKLQSKTAGDDESELGLSAAVDKDELNVHAIDAFWLQREVATFEKDATEARNIAESVLAMLANAAAPDSKVENDLVTKFEFQHVPLIRKLIKNRWKGAPPAPYPSPSAVGPHL
jgi:pre-mRNA-splicing helicase BRR2